MSYQRHRKLEYVSARLTARLKRIAGAYRLGNIDQTEALMQAEATLTEAFQEILKYTRNVPVKRDLGKVKVSLSGKEIETLKTEVQRKLSDFKQVLVDITNA